MVAIAKNEASRNADPPIRDFISLLPPESKSTPHVGPKPNIPVLSGLLASPLPGHDKSERIYVNSIAIKNAFFRSWPSLICIWASHHHRRTAQTMPQCEIYLTNCRPSHPVELCKIIISRMGPAENTNTVSSRQECRDLHLDVQLVGARLNVTTFFRQLHEVVWVEISAPKNTFSDVKSVALLSFFQLKSIQTFNNETQLFSHAHS